MAFAKLKRHGEIEISEDCENVMFSVNDQEQDRETVADLAGFPKRGSLHGTRALRPFGSEGHQRSGERAIAAQALPRRNGGERHGSAFRPDELAVTVPQQLRLPWEFSFEFIGRIR